MVRARPLLQASYFCLCPKCLRLRGGASIPIKNASVYSLLGRRPKSDTLPCPQGVSLILDRSLALSAMWRHDAVEVLELSSGKHISEVLSGCAAKARSERGSASFGYPFSCFSCVNCFRCNIVSKYLRTGEPSNGRRTAHRLHFLGGCYATTGSLLQEALPGPMEF